LTEADYDPTRFCTVEVAFKSPWFNLRQDELTLPSGREITYTVIDHPGYAMCVPLLDDGRVVTVEVHRHTVGATLLECPAGGLDGEVPEVAARRELEEETGYTARELTALGSFYGSPGSSNENFHLFLATGLSHDGEIAHEETEQIRVVKTPIETLYELAISGRETMSSTTCLAVILAYTRLNRS